jgi:hypothetical protein
VAEPALLRHRRRHGREAGWANPDVTTWKLAIAANLVGWSRAALYRHQAHTDAAMKPLSAH